MSGPVKRVPTTAAAAKLFVRAAFAANRYELDSGGHCARRMLERKLTLDDLKNAVVRMIRIEEYPGSQPWATSWRVIGPDLDGGRIGIGVKLYVDEDLEWAVCITVIDGIE